MRLTVRRIGNSLGVIVPRGILDGWGLREGDSLELTDRGIGPPRRRLSGHRPLDELRRRIALEVASRFRPEQIRSKSLANLERWKEAGVWCGAYDEWWDILHDPDDGHLYAAMLGQTDDANRLRQSMPYAGMLSKDTLERLREEAAR